MVNFSSLAISSWLMAATSSVVYANQDTAYYPGYTNPNVDKFDMYYRDSINVLQDLVTGEFSKLFIQFHGCVWSEYGNGADFEYDVGCSAEVGNNGGNNNNGDGENGWYDDGSSQYAQWYIGRTQCFRANAAYSLYGIKASDESNADSSDACIKKHYINSFFTNYGIESFGDPLGVDYENAGASSYCNNDENDDEGNNNNGQQQQDEDGEAYEDGHYGHGSFIYDGYSSYGTGCSADGKFIMAKFSGAFCNGNDYSATLDTFDNLNEYMEEKYQCLQVYDNSDMDYYAAVADGGGEGQNQDENWEQVSGSASKAFQLLAYSSACSVSEYPNGRCPDPHGVKTRRDKALYRKAKGVFRKVPLIMPILSGIFGISALYLFFLSWKTNRLAKRRQRRDPMETVRSQDGTGEKGKVVEPTSSVDDKSWVGTVTEGVGRTVSVISHQSSVLKERLQSYAEEEEDISMLAGRKNMFTTTADPEDQVGDYVSPIVSTASSSVHLDLPKSETEEEQKGQSVSSPTAGSTTLSPRVDSMPPDVTKTETEPTAAAMSPKAESSVKVEEETEDKKEEQETTEEPAAAASPKSAATSNSGIEESKTEEETNDDDKKDEKAEEEVANAILAEKGVQPKPETTTTATTNSKASGGKSDKKKYKRPKLAKISKLLFGKKK